MIIPCLIQTPIIDQKELMKKHFSHPFKFIFKFGPIPPFGFSSRMIVRMLTKYCNGGFAFCGGCVFLFEEKLIRMDIIAGEIKLQIQCDKNYIQQNIFSLVKLFEEIFVIIMDNSKKKY